MRVACSGPISRHDLDAVLAQILVHGVERLEGVGHLVPLALGAGERRVGGGVGDDQDAQQPLRGGGGGSGGGAKVVRSCRVKPRLVPRK